MISSLIINTRRFINTHLINTHAMKKLLLPVFAVSALLLNSCSTTQLAGQADSNDDVYYTEAKAKVIQPPAERVQSSTPNKSYRTDEQLYGDEYSDNSYRNNRYDDDYTYSSRINRFYYNSPYRPYYDYRYSYGYNPWYTYSYDPFFYDPWLYRPGVSVWIGTGRYWSPYNYGYYGSRYNNGYWGPYSYYNTYPGYNYGGRYYSGGGYYNGGVYNNPNHRARPDRESGMGRSGNNDPQTGIYIPSTGRPNRSSVNPNRTPDGRISSSDQGSSGASSQPSSTSSRPNRPSRTQEAAAPRQQTAPAPRPEPREYSRPERSSSPAPSSSGSSSGGGSSNGSSSGGSSSGSRPSRGGR